LLENGFKRGHIDKTLFTKTKGHDFIIIQIYVDDIHFGATNNTLCEEFSSLMSRKFEMSIMGEFTFFTQSSNQTMQRMESLSIK